MEISLTRKSELSKLADFVSSMFSEGYVTKLEDIVQFEQLELYVDHYEDCFDGMLVYDEDQFHIHINLDRGNNWTTNRGRFSISGYSGETDHLIPG